MQHGHQVLVSAPYGFSPDGRRIVTGCLDTLVRIWDTTTGQQAVPPMKHADYAYASFSPDGRWVLSWSSDGTARVWARPPAPRGAIRCATPPPWARRCSAPTGPASPPCVSTRLSASGTRRPAGSCCRRCGTWRGWSHCNSAPMAVTCSPPAPTAQSASGTWPGQPRGSPDAEYGEGLSRRVQSRRPSPGHGWPGGHGPRVGCGDGRCLRVHPWSIRPPGSLRPAGSSRGSSARMAARSPPWPPASAPSAWMPMFGTWRPVRCDSAPWPIPSTDRPRRPPSGSSPGVPTAGCLATAAGRSQWQDPVTAMVRIWDARTGVPLMPFYKQDSPVYRLDFSPDGRSLVMASGSRNVRDRPGEARILDADSSASRLTITTPNVCTSARFSADGRRLLTASGQDESQARVWDAATGSTADASDAGDCPYPRCRLQPRWPPHRDRFRRHHRPALGRGDRPAVPATAAAPRHGGGRELQSRRPLVAGPMRIGRRRRHRPRLCGKSGRWRPASR